MCQDVIKATTLKYVGADIKGNVQVKLKGNSGCHATHIFPTGLKKNQILKSDEQNGFTIYCKGDDVSPELLGSQMLVSIARIVGNPETCKCNCDCPCGLLGAASDGSSGSGSGSNDGSSGSDDKLPVDGTATKNSKEGSSSSGGSSDSFSFAADAGCDCSAVQSALRISDKDTQGSSSADNDSSDKYQKVPTKKRRRLTDKIENGGSGDSSGSSDRDISYNLLYAPVDDSCCTCQREVIHTDCAGDFEALANAPLYCSVSHHGGKSGGSSKSGSGTSGSSGSKLDEEGRRLSSSGGSGDVSSKSDKALCDRSTLFVVNNLLDVHKRFAGDGTRPLGSLPNLSRGKSKSGSGGSKSGSGGSGSGSGSGSSSIDSAAGTVKTTSSLYSPSNPDETPNGDDISDRCEKPAPTLINKDRCDCICPTNGGFLDVGHHGGSSSSGSSKDSSSSGSSNDGISGSGGPRRLTDYGGKIGSSSKNGESGSGGSRKGSWSGSYDGNGYYQVVIDGCDCLCPPDDF